MCGYFSTLVLCHIFISWIPEVFSQFLRSQRETKKWPVHGTHGNIYVKLKIIKRDSSRKLI